MFLYIEMEEREISIIFQYYVISYWDALNSSSGFLFLAINLLHICVCVYWQTDRDWKTDRVQKIWNICKTYSCDGRNLRMLGRDKLSEEKRSVIEMHSIEKYHLREKISVRWRQSHDNASTNSNFLPKGLAQNVLLMRKKDGGMYPNNLCFQSLFSLEAFLLISRKKKSFWEESEQTFRKSIINTIVSFTKLLNTLPCGMNEYTYIIG